MNKEILITVLIQDSHHVVTFIEFRTLYDQKIVVPPKATDTQQTNVGQHVFANNVGKQKSVVCSKSWPTFYVGQQCLRFTNLLNLQLFVVCPRLKDADTRQTNVVQQMLSNNCWPTFVSHTTTFVGQQYGGDGGTQQTTTTCCSNDLFNCL